MHASAFHIRGVVEGFYGVYYTFPERNDLLRFLGRHGYNTYIYAPKNDRQHRARWWEPYPDEVMAQFAETIAIARAAGIDFCYAIAPISYGGEQDLRRVAGKLRAFFDLGVRSFCVLMDDIMPSSDADPQGRGFLHIATLHAQLCNRLLAQQRELDPACTLAMCPVDYFGRAPFSGYLHALGELLHPAIDIFYTGPQICSPAIAAADARDFAAAVRRPPVIWDNYPANDLAMRGELHLGALHGRDPQLGGAVRGLVANPMNQAAASQIALASLAEYLADSTGYNPDGAWERALLAVAGQASYRPLRMFAETLRASCLAPGAAPRMVALVDAVMERLHADDLPGALAPAAVLEAYLGELDEACYHLKNRMAHLALRADLVPWIEALEDWIWLGKRSAQALVALEGGQPTTGLARWIAESFSMIERHNKHSGGATLLPLAEYVHERV